MAAKPAELQMLKGKKITGRGSSTSPSAACICEAFFLKAPGENDVKNTATKLTVLL